MLLGIALMTLIVTSASAQRFENRPDNNRRDGNGRDFDRRDNNRPDFDRREDNRPDFDRREDNRPDFDRRDDRLADRGTDLSRNYSWGYDAQYNRINRSRSASRMINSFQQQARERIAWGISRGLITGRESRRLLEFAERIEWKENRFMRNGRLSSGQAQELKRDLLVLDRMITQAKTNGDQQGGRRW